VPLRRIVTPFGYGESQAVADNTTRSAASRIAGSGEDPGQPRAGQPVQPIRTPSSSGATSMLVQ
jgi:hypothetical protein